MALSSQGIQPDGSINNHKNALSSSDLCFHCMRKTKRLICIPCGHLCACIPCGHTVHSCYVCRSDVMALAFNSPQARA